MIVAYGCGRIWQRCSCLDLEPLAQSWLAIRHFDVLCSATRLCPGWVRLGV